MKLLTLLIFLSSCGGSASYISINQTDVNQAIKKVAPLLKDTYNKEIIFYVDLRRSSGSYRFFVVDQKTGHILDKGLACNGVTDRNNNVIYSNRPGSNASSRGIYKVGSPYKGRFGKAYKLHGLESTNSNAFRRAVVLHSHKYVPSVEVGVNLFQSQGCPTVSRAFLKSLSKYIDTSDKPILLLIE